MMIVLLLTTLLVPLVPAFAPPSQAPQRSSMMVLSLDPVALSSLVGDFGMAVGGVAIGALSQLPRINSLQEQLEETKNQLKEETEKSKSQLRELEDKLFLIDQEYEAQTEKFKKEYDLQAKTRLDATVQQIKSDYQERLENRMEQMKREQEIDFLKEKSRLLTEKSEAVRKLMGDSYTELTQLQFQNQDLVRLNEKLENAIAKANEEMEHLRQEVATQSKKRFFGLF